MNLHSKALPLLGIILLLVSPTDGQGASNSDAVEAMGNLSRNCQEIVPLTFPRPEDNVDRDLETYKLYRGYVLRDLAEVKRLNPSALSSNEIVVGKPFADTVRTGLALIKSNDDALAKYQSGLPDKDALEKLDDGIREAEYGVNWMANPKRYNATWPALQELYKQFEASKQAAASIDRGALEYRKAKLAELEETFVKPFLLLKARNEKSAAINQAIKADEEQSRLNLRNADQSEDSRQKTILAKKRGMAGPWTGVSNLINALGTGQLSLKAAKQKLVFAGGEAFKVLNTSKDHIFYISESSRYDDPVTFALLRDPDEFYGDNAPFKAQVLTVVGADRFTTALGTEKDIVILKAEPNINDEERLSAAPGRTQGGEEVTEAVGPWGVGAQVFKARTVPVLVQDVIPGGPAEKAGLKSLDHITKIDGKDVSDLTLEESIAKLRGEKDSTVILTVVHADSSEPVEISVKRAPLEASKVQNR